MWGAPRVTMAMLEDTAGLLRRLWAGEKIFGHDGPAGRFGYLTTELAVTPPPLVLAALGPKTQTMGGRAFDAVLLHSHWTDRAVAACVERCGAAPSRRAAIRTPCRCGPVSSRRPTCPSRSSFATWCDA
jgi:alkanesulfonate monooxygenase SsuD/methylene tetrahydromethanopterin reductase-like flavin-dependent oxidoreductase (luciferase family)